MAFVEITAVDHRNRRRRPRVRRRLFATFVGVVATATGCAQRAPSLSGPQSSDARSELELRNALALDKEAQDLLDNGQYDKAERLFKEALARINTAYPVEDYPDGHTAIAEALEKIALCLESLGKSAEAASSYEQALAMRRRLFPANKFPAGHAEIASTLSANGRVLAATGATRKGVDCCHEAVSIQRRLFPSSAYPDGHRDLADALNALSMALAADSDYPQALISAREALAMMQSAYPPALFPDGDVDVATSFNNVGYILVRLGQLPAARGYLEQSAEMIKRLANRPGGNAAAVVIGRIELNLGQMFAAQGEHVAAIEHFLVAKDIFKGV
jgi:tetratricopeptide (TPR) repeat protein